MGISIVATPTNQRKEEEEESVKVTLVAFMHGKVRHWMSFKNLNLISSKRSGLRQKRHSKLWITTVLKCRYSETQSAFPVPVSI